MKKLVIIFVLLAIYIGYQLRDTFDPGKIITIIRDDLVYTFEKVTSFD